MRLRDDFVAVKVPATSANLGPGFDSMGLALDLWDEVSVHATTGVTSVVVEGEGAGNVELGEDNLVVRALRLALDRVGAPQVGVRMRCTNRIPHSRGLGSSASAIVAGVTLARALIGDADVLGRQETLEIGSHMEGHPDNVAPAVFGGATVSWMNEETSEVGSVRLTPPVPPCPRQCRTATRVSTLPAALCWQPYCRATPRRAGERTCTASSWRPRAIACTRSSVGLRWNPRLPSSTGCAVPGSPRLFPALVPRSSPWNPWVRISAGMLVPPGGESSRWAWPPRAYRSPVEASRSWSSELYRAVSFCASPASRAV